MKPHNNIFLTVVAGAISGILVLGIFGRIVTTCIEFTMRNKIHYSLPGLFEIVLVGLIVGAIGGFVYFIIKYLYQIRNLTIGLFVGLIMFLCSTIYMVLTDRVAFGIGPTYLLLAMAIIVFILYGIFIPTVISWLVKFREY